MHFTRPRELLVAGVVGFGLAFVAFRTAYGALPSLPTTAGVTLLVLGVVEAALAFVVRSRIRSGRVFTGVGIARAAVLAKASSVLGALMAGGWLGAIAYLGPRTDQLTAAADDLPAAIVGACCAAALLGAALWLEHCCRTPNPRDQNDDRRVTG